MSLFQVTEKEEKLFINNKTQKKGIKKEKHMLFMNINLKSLNITLAKRILQCIYSDQVELIVAVLGWFNIEKSIRKKLFLLTN